MRITRKTLILVLAAVAIYFVWQSYSFAADESGTLRTTGSENEDRFATVWVVDAGAFSWIRAEGPAQPWFAQLRANPQVELRFDGRNARYSATVLDRPDIRRDVDALFRAKYGLADQIRWLRGGRDTIPIRLDPR